MCERERLSIIISLYIHNNRAHTNKTNKYMHALQRVCTLCSVGFLHPTQYVHTAWKEITFFLNSVFADTSSTQKK